MANSVIARQIYTPHGTDLYLSGVYSSTDPRTQFQDEDSFVHHPIVNGDGVSPFPHSYLKTRKQHSKGYYRYAHVKYVGNMGGRNCDLSWGGPQSETTQALLDTAYASAYGKLIQKSRNRYLSTEGSIGHDLLIDVFESRELKALYIQLRELMQAMKSRRLLRLVTKVHPSVAIAEYYLLWTFGIKPLIDSIEQILATLHQGLDTQEDKIKGTGTAQSFDMARVGSGMSAFDYERLVQVRTSIAFTRKLIDVTAAIKAQFGINTVGASAYAVLPLSFVLDWFVDVGGYLSALEHVHSNTGYQFSRGYQSTTIRTSVFRQCDNHTSIEDNVGSSFESYVQFDRTLLSKLPNPPLPTFKPRLNGGKILSLAALIRVFTK